ncbi:Hypp5354 [Branchiostoma lanceolatum]|uniref:Hypp5354 protein n=1 Tax=Branchiostoma lanceolatum TaxID=7740 RepID=A0A8K0AFU1_BRALA|nr:Hypp5354 [Branchiostoma lanceolatum]
MEQGLGGNSSLRKSYSIIKKLRRGFQPKQRNIKSEDNRVLTDLQSILQRWKQYCEQLYKDNTPHSDPDDEQDTPSEETGDAPFPEILESEVEHAIKRLPKNKAAGVDDLPGELLKTDNPAITKALCCLCNKILKTGEWPTDWVRSVFITIPKKTGTTDCSEHRTIALITHASKILLRILLKRMEGVARHRIC